MKKCSFSVAIVVAMICVAQFSWAEEVLTQPGDTQLTSTFVFKNDIIKSTNEKTRFGNGLWTFVHKGSWGGGFDSCVDYKYNYRQIQPYLTYNKGPWYGLVGASTDSEDNNHAQVGFWHMKTLESGLFTLVDIRNYFAVNSKPNSYLDAFGEFTFPIFKKLFHKKLYAGADAEYIHFWEHGEHNCLFFGPIIGYRFNKNVAVFARASRNWDIIGGDSARKDQLRLAVQLDF